MNLLGSGGSRCFAAVLGVGGAAAALWQPDLVSALALGWTIAAGAATLTRPADVGGSRTPDVVSRCPCDSQRALPGLFLRMGRSSIHAPSGGQADRRHLYEQPR
jgi:hypothetical protein